jgi:hypothetical protein
MRYAITLIVIDIFGYTLKAIRPATFLRRVKKMAVLLASFQCGAWGRGGHGSGWASIIN